MGLGVGTLAAYGRAGDHYTFYEIDPDVIRLVRDEEYFSFLRDTTAEVEIVEGDARLSLESELRTSGGREFDILVIDAFSSEAIPVHLITQQAFDLYVQHLRRGGVLALHISNVYLNLGPLALRLGTTVGMQGAEVINRSLPRLSSLRSRWIFLCDAGSCLPDLAQRIIRRRGPMGLDTKDVVMHQPKPEPGQLAPIWTDQFSDLLAVLKPSKQTGIQARKDQ